MVARTQTLASVVTATATLGLALATTGGVACRRAVAPATTGVIATGDAATNADADATEGANDDASSPRTESITLVIDGRTRSLRVHTPGGAAAGGRALVLNLHGSGGTAADQEIFSDMDRVADANGFIVVYPDGAIALGAGFAWNVPGQPLSGGGAVPDGAADDVSFFAQAIAALVPRYTADPRRIFVTGMSGGARMASQLGCDLSMQVAAVAPVAGLRFPAPCDGPRPVPVVSFHGTADPVNPYDGGGPAYWTYSVTSAAQQWAAHDGCDAAPAVSQAADGVTLTAYAGCAGAATVALYTIAGTGHEWPGAPQQTPAIDASAVMWDFFVAHPLPADPSP